MDEEAVKPRDSTANQQRQYYYGTFQGVANYHPPAPPPQLIPELQQPQHPIATSPLFPPGHGYQNVQGFFSLSLILDNYFGSLLFCDCLCLRLVGHGGGFVNYAQGFPVVPGTSSLIPILFIHFWRNLLFLISNLIKFVRNIYRLLCLSDCIVIR